MIELFLEGITTHHLTGKALFNNRISRDSARGLDLLFLFQRSKTFL